MQASVRVTLLLAAWLAVLPAARGQTPKAEAAAPGDVRLPLRMEETLRPPVAPGTGEELPIFIEADRIQGVQGKELEAVGNVVVRRRGQVLSADKLYYSIPENAVTATGHVRVDRLGDVVTGDRARYDLDTSAGYIDYPTYSFRQYRGPRQGQPSGDRGPRRVPRGTGGLHQLRGRRRRLVPEGRTRGPRSPHRRGRGAQRERVLQGRPDLLHALDGLPPDQPAQDRFPGADDRHRQQQRIRDRDAVLLEHRAQPRLHLCAPPDGAPRAAAQQRVSLPRAALRRRGPLRLPA